MGMFDYIACAYPLPEGAPVDDYQTKDTPNQMLMQYTISEDGYLKDETGNVVNFDGPIEFYHSNVSATGPAGYLTEDDKFAEMWTFLATFEQGKLIRIEGGKDTLDEFYAKPPVSREIFFRELR